jgi:hypothetical protein
MDWYRDRHPSSQCVSVFSSNIYQRVRLADECEVVRTARSCFSSRDITVITRFNLLISKQNDVEHHYE